MALLQTLFPLYLVYKLWHIPYKTLKHWLIRFSFTLSIIILFFLIGRWDVTGYGMRYWLNSILILVSMASLAKVYHLPFAIKNRNKGIHWGTYADLLFALAMILWVIAGHYPDKPAVQLSAPLKGNQYVAVQGGDTYLVNYHGLFAEPQKYALDVVKVNDWGFRASGVYPADPGDYSIYADTVYSPADGVVLSSRKDLPDQRPPKTNGEKPYGNYLWIESDSLHIVLAHLKQGSLQVSKGDTLQAGQPVARVGNTGNTSEPHLHIHAVTFAEDVKWIPDSTRFTGNPIPIRIEGNFLSRNQKIP